MNHGLSPANILINRKLKIRMFVMLETTDTGPQSYEALLCSRQTYIEMEWKREDLSYFYCVLCYNCYHYDGDLILPH